MKNIGGSDTFRLFGLAALACALLHFVVQKLLDRFSNERGKIYNCNDKSKGDGKGDLTMIADGNGGINKSNDSKKASLLLNNGDNGFVDVNLDDVTKL